jgi:hypothetical protein
MEVVLVHNILITGAPADVSGKCIANLLVGLERMKREHVRDGHDEAWRAKSALQGVMIAEGLLNAPKTLARTLAFDCFDGKVVGLDRKCQTGPRTPSLDQDRTSAAGPLFATHMGSREMQFVSQEVAEQHARFDPSRMCQAIDYNGDFDCVAHKGAPSLARRHASLSTFLASSPTKWRR